LTVIGKTLGSYQLLEKLGEGGMGEVYRARDTRLDRTVAVKLLSPAAAGRPDRHERFRIEARAISSLSHPHICTLFDVGEQDGVAFLVMEYLEGETLDDRLTGGPLSTSEVLLFATQIASALDHAHRQGVTHRDLKPSNVMLTESGAKLLDFGLAKGPAFAPPACLSTVSHHPEKLTAEGAILGTFQYMAPEQLEGKPADERTDIFAFGTVVYEMATGRRAFEGKSQASLIASILTKQPASISSTRGARRADGLPDPLDHVVERCLAKSPGERWQTARDVMLELEWISKRSSQGEVTVARASSRRARQIAAWLTAAVATTAGAGVGYVTLRDLPTTTMRFVVAPPPGTVVGTTPNRLRVAISPDGQHLAFVASSERRQQIWIHSFQSGDPRPLAGTEGGVSPFWSPDSRFIGFFAPGEGVLKKVAITGGPPRTICAAETDGAPTWGANGTILFTQSRDGIYRVSGDGGPPTRVTRRDPARREINHYWPSFLPDGRHFLYMATARDAGGRRTTPSIYVASLDSPQNAKLLKQMHSRMVYVQPGYLLFVEAGALLAQPFDIAKLRLTGEPVKIADGIAYSRTLGTAAFTVSDTGVLAYQGIEDTSELVWYDRRGGISETGWERQNFGKLRISPDGRSVASSVVDPRTGTADVWIFDVARGAPVRFTTDLEDEWDPVWSPDGRRIMFTTPRTGAPDLVAKSFDESQSEELIANSPRPLTPEDWSRDGDGSYTQRTPPKPTGTCGCCHLSGIANHTRSRSPGSKSVAPDSRRIRSG